MPDTPIYIKRTHPIKLPFRKRSGNNESSGRHGHRFAELRCKTNFSFLRGASHPEELAEMAAKLGYYAIAITDRNTLAGVVRMHCAARACGIKLIVGAEITPTDAPPVTLYATDRAAYGRLCRVITQGRLRAKKGECHVTFDDIAQWNEGLIATVHGSTLIDSQLRAADFDPRDDSGGIDRSFSNRHSRRLKPAARGKIATSHGLKLAARVESQVFSWVHTYRDIFGDRLYLTAGVHSGADDERHLAEMNTLSRATNTVMIATNDVHYHEPDRRFLQDVLTCVRERCTLEQAGRRLFANAERHLKSIENIAQIFAEYPEAVTRTVELADRCRFRLDELRYEYPEALCPPDRTPHDYLAELTWAGAAERYPGGLPEKVLRSIEHELKLICELQYEPYFLTVWDIVKFARSRGILCQGRGSAANSAVCYCLGITSVDPDQIDLLFERFVSAERNEPPDIDVDFEHERREEVFQYIYEKFGREHAGIVAEVITYRPRSAIRDVGKALGLSLDHTNVLAKKHEWWDKNILPKTFLKEIGLDPADRTLCMLQRLVKQLVGFPRHLSQHVGGFVITRRPLCEMVPIENAAMPDRTFIEWDKDDIDALGILKIDCLALGMLTAIQKCFRLLGAESKGSLAPSLPSALHEVPPEDPAVYDMIDRADTVGVFQIESRAQMSMLPRLKPRCFYDLVIEVAIVRPGPIQGGMVHPYLRRRSGQESITYPNDAIKEVLERTLGVPLFQEQAMKLAVVAAGFTPGEADQLRRAMGAWRKNGDIDRFHDKLITGMKKNGLSGEFAERCFKQISGFGEYGFPESHAASFALLVYVSAWLKRYHPAAFCASILNSQPMGFYHPAQLVRDAREHGVIVLPVDVNHSGYDARLEERDVAQVETCGSEKGRNVARVKTCGPANSSDDLASWGVGGPAVRLGMRLVKGISHTKAEGIERAQRERPFVSVVDLAYRSGASRATLARLAAADAMRSLGLNRREAVWQVLALDNDPPLLEGLEPAEPEVNLPKPTLEETVYEDYDIVGLSLTAHPIGLIRHDLKRMGVEPTRALRNARHGQRLRVAGLVLVRQRPSTAKGIVFCTLEDETGVANLIIPPDVYQRYRNIAHSAVALVAEGKAQRLGQVVHLKVSRVSDLTKKPAVRRSMSRDFH